MRSFASELLTRRQTTSSKRNTYCFSVRALTLTVTLLYTYDAKAYKTISALRSWTNSKAMYILSSTVYNKKHRSPLRKRDMMG